MRILILNWRDIKHPLAGGAEIATHEHAKGWIKAGHEVIQFSSSFPKSLKKEVIDGITIIRGGSHYTVHFFAFLYYLRELRRNKFDLVVDEFHFVPFFTPLYVRGKKMAFIHETAEETWFKNIRFPVSVFGYILEPLLFLLYRKAPFMTCSNSTKEDLMKFGIAEKNITIVLNGASFIQSEKTKEKYPVILYLGRLAQDKGIEDAIRAFYEIHKGIGNVSFWIVGKEEKKGYAEKLRKLIESLRIEKKVTFFGHVSESQKFDLIKRSWVLIHPAIKEGWGLTVIEAASQGRPTVGYNVSGLKDSIKHRETGILVDVNNVPFLAQAVLDLLGNKTLYDKLSKNATQWSKRFSWGDSSKKSLALLKRIIK